MRVHAGAVVMVVAVLGCGPTTTTTSSTGGGTAGGTMDAGGNGASSLGSPSMMGASSSAAPSSSASLPGSSSSVMVDGGVFVGAGTHRGPEAFSIVDMGWGFVPRALDEAALNGGPVIVAGDLELDAGVHAAMWLDGTLTDLHARITGYPGDPPTDSFVFDIGTGIVGHAVSMSNRGSGFWFINGQMDDFGQRPGFGGTIGDTFVRAVNTNQQALARGRFPDGDGGFIRGGVLLEDDVPITPLPGPPGFTIDPVDMLTDLTRNHVYFTAMVLSGFGNLSGCIRGDVADGTFESWPDCLPWDMNNHHQIIGDFFPGPGLWNAGAEPLDLGVMPATRFSTSPLLDWDLNDLGLAVGGGLFFVGIPNERTIDEMLGVDFAQVLPAGTGWDLVWPTHVNNGGTMAGRGFKPDGQHGVLITPTTTQVARPPAPQNLQGVRVPGFPSTVHLWWDDVAENEWFYLVERQQEGRAWEVVRALPANSSTFADMGTTGAGLVRYRLRAWNMMGESDVVELPSAL